MEHLHSGRENIGNSEKSERVGEAENRELQRLFVSMERDEVTVSYLDIAFFSLGSKNTSVQSFLGDYTTKNSTNIMTLLHNSYGENANTPNISQETSDIPENPAFTQKLQYSQRAIENVFANLQHIQNTFNNSTNLTTAFIDRTISLFSDDTVFSAYQSQFAFAQSSGENILHSLHTIDVNILTPAQKEEYDSILQTLHFLSTLKLERTGFLQMLKNEIYAIPHTVDLMAYAVKGVVTGVYEGVKNIITSVADLAIFLGKYSFSSEYRTQINDQAENIRNIIDTHGLSHISDQIFHELDKEMTRISKLPDLEKSEAIGKLTGHILSFLGVAGGAVKVATRIEKLGTLSTLSAIGKAEKISLYTFDILLNGVAETAIMKSISASYKGVKAMLANTELALAEKIRILDTEFANIQQFKSEVPEEIHILGKYKEELIYQKQIFQRLEQAKEVQVPYLEQLRNIDQELESLRTTPYSQITEREVRIQQLKTEKIRVNIERQVVGLEKLGVPEEFSRDLLGSGLLVDKIPGKDLLGRFEWFLNRGIDYNRLIENARKTIPRLTKEDGIYVFMYTDLIFYQKVNGFMRGIPEVLENMTPEHIQIATKFTQRLEEAFEKMPNMNSVEGENIIVVYRGDSWQGWVKEIGEEIELPAFTSVADNMNDILLPSGSNIFVTIEGMQGKVKDITSLALVPNFGEKLKGITHVTQNEGIILPNAKMEIQEIKNGSYKGKDVIKIHVKQTQ